MDAFSDHALPCSRDSRSGGFQFRQSLVQRYRCTILGRTSIYHLESPLTCNWSVTVPLFQGVACA